MILEARYGIMNTSHWIDVTTILQFFVRNSRLCLTAQPKSNLLGFFDIDGSTHDVGKKKVLQVRYSFRQDIRIAVVENNQPLILP